MKALSDSYAFRKFRMRNKQGMGATGVTGSTRQSRNYGNVPAIVRSRTIELAVQRSVCVSDARGRGFGPYPPRPLHRRRRRRLGHGACTNLEGWLLSVGQEEQGGMKRS